MNQKLSEKALDLIINEMIEVVENSKDEIFNISEESRKEHDYLLAELQETKEKVIKHIDEGDELEQRVRFSRRRLSKVNRDFDKYSEEEVRAVYESTHSMQTELAVMRQEEKVLRERRDDLERRLISLSETIDRASGLASKISVILTYLYDDFRQVNTMIEDAKEKQEFSLQIIEAQEEERRKISREIHDGPAQMLANILLRSELVEKVFREGTINNALDEIKSVREMIRTSLYEVRRIIYDLRPMALDDLGLVPTIKKYIDTLADHNEAKIEFMSIGKERRLYQKYEIAFFRLMQEALMNAMKHAKASLVKVKLEIGEHFISMLIDDDGVGFDPDARRDKSFGITGMRERVEMLGGKITIDSEVGTGTKVYIKVPYKNVPSPKDEKNLLKLNEKS